MRFPENFIYTPEGVVFLIFLFFALAQLFYYWYYFARVAFLKTQINNKQATEQPAVSVIICAKNEYENLKNNLSLILEQDYPDFEVILVNDFSQDDSYFLLKSLEEKYSHFKVIHLRENVNFFEGKKLALAVGIKSSKNEHILLTDADCRPAGKHWIQNMSACFDDKKEIVLGYGAYEIKPGFLNKLIRFDTICVAMQYLGFALAGSPYMGVGRNLAYRKSLFFKAGGFASHYKVKSGDDDLFVNMVATKKNTAVCLHPDSITFSEPKPNFVSWFRQKKRHLSTGVHYKFSHKIKLGLFALSGNLFYLTFVLFLFFAQSSLSLIIVSGLFALRTISLVLLHYYAGKRFLERKLFLYSPIFDLLLIFLNPVFALSNLFYRKNKWK
ncbi:MAG: glycosyltransferase [Bacteroidetes bacterium]|nr:MAG: glycosyltransferase [Bacteroidota bacterium]